MNERLQYLLDNAYELRLYDYEDGIRVLVEDAEGQKTMTFILRHDDMTFDRFLDAWFYGTFVETIISHVEDVRYDDDVQEVISKLHDENVIVHVSPSQYAVMYDNIHTSHGRTFLRVSRQFRHTRFRRFLHSEINSENFADLLDYFGDM